ncbi:hypothetical protein [Actinomadura atramentaria]|uniref:hypothetical protein n=1 Tax=Actinomadura atramentaria TaxID=1990 RepID=UPI00196A1A32|nr:hypothetical protein [Actinomadura atramentaria]
MSQHGAGTGTRRSTVVRALIAVLGAVAAVLATASAAPAAAAPARPGTVVIGLPGMMWSDVTRERTPTLWRLAGEGGAASLSVRTTRPGTCPTDGWLTVSAGQRSRLEPGDCLLPAAPSAAPNGGASAAGWAAIKKDNAGTIYRSRVGLLGDAAHRAGDCTFAVGPGAVYGLADGSGRVDRYAPSPERATPQDWARCRLAAVEIDDVFRAYQAAGVDTEGEQVPVAEAVRARAASTADQRVAAVLRSLPPGTNVLVAGLSDIGVPPHLRIAAAWTTPGGASAFPRGRLTSSATHRAGLVTLTDVTATALRLLGLPQPQEAVGSPWRSARSAQGATAKIEALEDQDVAAQAIRSVQGSFIRTLVGAQVVLLGAAWLLLRRRPRPARRRLVLGGARIVALLGGSTPVAAFLAGAVPWWRTSHPAAALIATVTVLAAAVTGLALAGPWRRSKLAPSLIVAAVTAVVLGVDVMTGSHLQLNTFLGYTALVAGRFYGFGNQAFALFAAGAVLTAAWSAEYAIRAGRRWAAGAIVAAVGVAAVALDGLPAWGSDFGGVLAMVPVFAVLALVVAGLRVRWWWAAGFGAVAVALVLLISWLNARSANPTHLGKFWKDLVAGNGWEVVERKFNAMTRTLGFWPVTIVLAVALVALYFALADPARWRAKPLVLAYRDTETMRAALTAVVSVGLVGALVNDSGVIILSVSLVLAAPLTIAAALRSVERGSPARAGTAVRKPAPRPSAPTG